MDNEIERLRRENEVLRRRLAQVTASRPLLPEAEPANESSHPDNGWQSRQHELTSDQIRRYSRQLLLPSFGVQAQERLLNSSVLIVGAGGLGSSAALYLTAAGAGRIGIVDQDVVELNNLHRQIIHTEARVGMHKAESAAAACSQLDSSNKVETHKGAITSQNALQLVSNYHVVLDCTDNAPTRYLISDACVVAGKPLVSGAAIGTDGQLTVYNYGDDGPCYRCLFPVAPRPESCSRCSDAGVLGVIPGIIGSLQALEAIKIMAGVGQVASRKLVIFDGLAMRFHTVKLRARMKECIACCSDASITAHSLPAYSYTDFTGQDANDTGPPQLQLLPADQRASPEALAAKLQGTSKPLIIDVRPQREFELAHLSGSVNCPFEDKLLNLPHMVQLYKQHAQEPSSEDPSVVKSLGTEQIGRTESAVQQSRDNTAEQKGFCYPDVVVVCRRGNDSQRVVQALRAQGVPAAVDLNGGLSAWSHDHSFPDY